MSDIITYINIQLTILIGLIGFWTQLRIAIATHESWRWIKLGLAFICLLWSIIYIIVAINILRGFDDQNILFFRNWIIRPMISITLTLIAASGIARGRTHEHH